ncbi:MAG: ATPase involved in DNA repair [Candidatus Woesebacteria bacterium]|nr:MAG: ATPase involved in DNA repair [Candidatus Woesebacteria bacterium]
MSDTTTKPYRGSEWKKWDLQIHTYLDPNWKWPSGYPNGNDRQQERIAKFENDFIRHCIENRIEGVAITDHNAGDAIDGLLVKNRELGNKVTILPGVEVASDGGTHLLIIFDPSSFIRKNRWNTWRETVDHFLTAIFTDNPRFEEQNGRNTPLNPASSIDQIIKKAKEYSAIVIFPHVFSQGTGLFSCDSRTRKRVLKTCNILDIACVQRDIQKKTDEANRKLTGQGFDSNDFAFINTSDSRRIEDVGSKFTWIKADATFEGLRQIIHEPKTRVSIQENPPLYLHPQIISAKLLNASSYQSKKSDFPPITLTKEIFFSPNLTTIIGPRAAGKTVLVELIGYVANRFSTDKRDKKLPLVEFLSKEFSDIEIEVTFQSGAEEVTTLKRPVKEWNDPFYTSPFKIEYWAQGEIERIANSSNQISDYIEQNWLNSDFLTKTKREIETLQKEMKSLRGNYSNKLQIEIEKKKLEAERKQIEAYFNKLKAEEYKQITGKIKENRVKRQMIEGLVQDIKNQAALLKNLAVQVRFFSTVDKDKVLELFSARDPLRKKIEGFYQLKETQLDAIVTDLETTAKAIEDSDVKKSLDKENTELIKQFTDYCKTNGIMISKGEVEKRNDRIKFIDQQVSKLESQLQKFEGDQKRHGQLAAELSTKLKLWEKENNKLINGFNRQFGNTQISAFWNNPASEIAGWIKAQFLDSNSNLKGLIEKNFKTKSPVREDYLADIIDELVDKYGDKAREEIASILKQNKAPKLQDSSGKTETIRWFFEDENTKPIREDIIMRLNEYAETGNNYIKYGNKVLGKDSMSFGERCGTLVELILLSGDHPLIIDQPEDHLDAKFVAERVVTLIREQKPNRQIIICTHNANIVVLGDSELVTALAVSSRDKVSIEQGSLENIQMKKTIFDVLEGGESAFKKREQKYGEAIS